MISAALITLNEQENLPALFDTLGWVDEIVVVDGGSTDATVDIARRHGARVYRRPFDTFARQRNHALALARGDWVLSIDADERPTPALAAEIRARLPHCRQNAFRVPIRSSIFGRPMRFSGTQDDRPIRLMRRGHARWTGDVHEVIECSGRIGRLRAPLEHITLPDLQAFLAKMGRYTTLEAAARVARGQPPTAAAEWLAPPREVFRRLFWKRGFLDGPEGWAFCLLSGLSAWVLAQRHRVDWEGGSGGRGDRCATAWRLPPWAASRSSAGEKLMIDHCKTCCQSHTALRPPPADLVLPPFCPPFPRSPLPPFDL